MPEPKEYVGIKPHLIGWKNGHGEFWYSYKEAATILGVTLEELSKMNEVEMFRHTETQEKVPGMNKVIHRVWLSAEDVDHLKAEALAEDKAKLFKALGAKPAYQ